jgi:hypothetical protein
LGYGQEWPSGQAGGATTQGVIFFGTSKLLFLLSSSIIYIYLF